MKDAGEPNFAGKVEAQPDFAAAFARSAAPTSLFLTDLTWPEVEGLVAQGWDSLLLMLGATEQHGPHLPLATDTIIGLELAQRVAARLGQTLIGPVVPLGTSDEHLDFAGTLSLSKETLAALIADVGRSAARHGFRRIIVLSSHGGNLEAVRMGVERLRRNEPGLKVIAQSDLLAWLRTLEGRQTSPGVAQNQAGWHAGERETAQMLHLRPDLVRLDQAQAGYLGDMREVLGVLTTQGLKPVTPNGVLGDPVGAEAAHGQLYLERLAQNLVEAIAAVEGRAAKTAVTSSAAF